MPCLTSAICIKNVISKSSLIFRFKTSQVLIAQGMGWNLSDIWSLWKIVTGDINKVQCKLCGGHDQRKHAVKCKKHQRVSKSAKEYKEKIFKGVQFEW